MGAPDGQRATGAWLRAWFPIAGVAILNGGLRDRVVAPRLGEQRAHQVATAVLVTSIWGGAAALSRVRPLADRVRARRVGLAWVGATLAFETALGLARGLPLSEVLTDCDLRAGRVWSLVPASMALSPVVLRCLVPPRRRA